MAVGGKGVGDKVEVGVKVSVGVKVTVGEKAEVRGNVFVGESVFVGEKTRVGAAAVGTSSAKKRCHPSQIPASAQTTHSKKIIASANIEDEEKRTCF